MYEYLIFDLDGTISDPKEGIVKSLNYALSANGYDTKDSKDIEKYIGPPLDYTFSKLTGVMDEKEIRNLIKSYRERYAGIGCSENILYKGMRSVLASLAKKYECRNWCLRIQAERFRGKNIGAISNPRLF